MWTEEFELIQDVQHGKLDSFTSLYERYFQKIYSFLLIKANGNVQLAEDVDFDENNIISWNVDYVDYFQKHIQSEQILAYLEELWWDKKDLFVLRIWNNLSYDEIWWILWKRGATCRKDFSRLIKKIANHFKHWIDN